MMRKLIYIFLLFTSIANAAPLEKTITLKQLTTQDSINFIGPGAEKALYFPIPAHWQTNSIRLHFIVKNSNLPNHPTSLTAFVNNQPLNSFNLQTLSSGTGTWDVTIPASAIKPDNVTLIIKSGWEIKDGAVCKSFSDPSFWTSIDGQSTVTYQYTENASTASLATFPQPFINPTGIEKDTAIIVLPDQFNHQDLETLFFISQGLTRAQTWRGIDINGTAVQAINDDMKNTKNLIVMGTRDKNSLLTSPLIKWPLTRNEKQEWLDKNQQKIPEDVGIVMIAPSPWNPRNVILAITGNSDAATTKAASWLRSPKLNRSLLSPDYALIKQVNTEFISPINWSDTSLKGLGFKSQTVYGDGESTLNYVIKLPPDKIAKDMDIVLHYKTSPLLAKTANSFLSLSVNQTPISGIRLEPSSSDEETWKIHLKADDLLRGDNLLSFTFHLKFHNNNCASDDQTLAYATIKENTSLSVRFKSQSGLFSFHAFNASTNDVALFLPKNNTYFTNNQFIPVVIAFAQALTNTPLFNVAFNDAEIDQTYYNRDLIFIGKLGENPVLAKAQSHFPFCLKNGLLDIRPTLLPHLTLSNEIPNALLEIVPSPFNPSNALLLISANTPNDYQSALTILTDANKNKFLKGDTALIYANGTFTSINAQKLLMKAENKHRLNEANFLSSTGLISFLVVFFGGILALILYRRLRRYFSKNNP